MIVQLESNFHISTGYGSSKREAKTNAAAKLLSELCGLKKPHASSYTVHENGGQDVAEYKKNPISIIHEYTQRNGLELKFTDGIEHGMFSCVVKVGALETTGLGWLSFEIVIEPYFFRR